MAASWEDEKVTEASSNSFVAIKIDTKRFAHLLTISLLLLFYNLWSLVVICGILLHCKNVDVMFVNIYDILRAVYC